MVINRFFSLALSSALCGLIILGNTAEAITIDHFDGLQSTSANGGNPNPAPNVANSGTAIGGTRMIETHFTGGSTSVNLNILPDNITQDGLLEHSQNSQVTGVSIVTWDGDLAAGTTNFDGFNGGKGIDLKQDGGNSFIFQVVSFDCPFPNPSGQCPGAATLKIIVYDATNPNGQLASAAEVSLNAPTLGMTVTLPFANFTQQGVLGPANFEKVGAIQFVITGSSPGVDLTLSDFVTNGGCSMVPDANGIACPDCKNLPLGPNLPGTPCPTGDVGVCADGTWDLACMCKPNKPPTAEICDQLDNDCDGQVDEIFDVCGICGGNGKSCIDCAGTPFGTKKLDQCNVCGGDGKSCLDCQGVVNGSAKIDKCGVCGGDNTSCLNCSAQDVTELLFSLDSGAKKQEKFIKKALKVLKRKKTDKVSVRYMSKTAARAHELQLRNWVLSWTIPQIINRCTNTVLCAEKSNAEITAEYRKHNMELYDLGADVVQRVAKSGQRSAALARENKELFEENVRLVESVPGSTSVCGG